MSAMVRSPHKLMQALDRARSSVARQREKVHEVVDSAMATAGAGATGFALGALKSAYGPQDIMGVPLDLAVGLSAHAVAMFVGDDAAKHLRVAGNAAIAIAAYNLGQDTVGGEGGEGDEVAGEGLPDSALP